MKTKISKTTPKGSVKVQAKAVLPISQQSTLVDDSQALVDDSTALTGSQTTQAGLQGSVKLRR